MNSVVLMIINTNEICTIFFKFCSHVDCWWLSRDGIRMKNDACRFQKYRHNQQLLIHKLGDVLPLGYYSCWFDRSQVLEDRHWPIICSPCTHTRNWLYYWQKCTNTYINLSEILTFVFLNQYSVNVINNDLYK